MTKGELLEALKPFTDEAEVVFSFTHNTLVAYHINGWKYGVKEYYGIGVLNLIASKPDQVYLKEK